MGLKKQLGLGVAAAALGLSLVSGGTYAYFSDTVTASGTMATGTLDVNVDGAGTDDIGFNIGEIKPGWSQPYDFTVSNDGSLKIGRLSADLKVTNVNDPDGDGSNLGNVLRVTEFSIDGHNILPKYGTYTLNQIAGFLPQSVSGLHLGKGSANIHLKLAFPDNGNDQNMYQGDSIKPVLTVTAYQEQ